MNRILAAVVLSSAALVAPPSLRAQQPPNIGIAPVTLGAGERLFDGVPPLSLEQVSARAASLVTHITYRVAR